MNKRKRTAATPASRPAGGTSAALALVPLIAPGATTSSAALTQLTLTIVSEATSTCTPFTIESMLHGRKVWCASTKGHTESVVLGLPAGSKAVRIEIASTWAAEACVEEAVRTRGRKGYRLGKSLLEWKHWGGERRANSLARARQTIGGYAPDGYTVSTVAVATGATRLRLSCRASTGCVAGVAIFRVWGNSCLPPAAAAKAKEGAGAGEE